MAVCPRCNATVPEGNDRCRVCGYGLPGTDAERSDPKRVPPPSPQAGPGGYEDDTSVHLTRHNDETGQTAAQTQIVLAPGRAFSVSAILLAFVCALGIVLAVIAITSPAGSTTRPPTTTSKPTTAAPATTTTVASTTTSSTTTSTTYRYVPPPTTTTTAPPPPTTTTTRPPPTTTTTHHPTTTTSSSSTTTTTPTTVPTTSTTVRRHH